MNHNLENTAALGWNPPQITEISIISTDLIMKVSPTG
jgi:hypothetical protein